MINQPIWINTSVFYASSYWHSILADCISPFINEMRNKHIIENYFFQFNNEQGDNIRICFRTPLLQSNNLYKKWQETVRFYIKKNPSPTTSITYPIENFFMNFPNNSFFDNNYLLYSKPSLILNQKELLITRQTISGCIIKAFKNERFNEENLFTFSLYLHLAILKAIFSNWDSALVFLKLLLNTISNNHEIYGQVNIDRKVSIILEENITIIDEITAQIILKDYKKHDLTWLKDWTDNFQKLDAEERKKNVVFLELCTLVNEHLNIKDTDYLPVILNIIYFSLLKRIKLQT